MAGRFGNVEAVFEVQCIVNEFPISHHSLGNPGLAAVVVHGGEGFSDDWVFSEEEEIFLVRAASMAQMWKY